MHSTGKSARIPGVLLEETGCAYNPNQVESPVAKLLPVFDCLVCTASPLQQNQFPTLVNTLFNCHRESVLEIQSVVIVPCSTQALRREVSEHRNTQHCGEHAKPIQPAKSVRVRI